MKSVTLKRSTRIRGGGRRDTVPVGRHRLGSRRRRDGLERDRCGAADCGAARSCACHGGDARRGARRHQLDRAAARNVSLPGRGSRRRLERRRCGDRRARCPRRARAVAEGRAGHRTRPVAGEDRRRALESRRHRGRQDRGRAHAGLARQGQLRREGRGQAGHRRRGVAANAAGTRAGRAAAAGRRHTLHAQVGRSVRRQGQARTDEPGVRT